MMKKLTDLITKYKELIFYVIFGGLNTVVNFLTFWLLSKAFGEEIYYINNALAWLVSVVFAFITNKLFVFEAKSFEKTTLLKEIALFFSARVFSFCIEEGGLVLFIEVFGFDKYSLEIFGFTLGGQLVAKLMLAVIVVISNFFASKFIIFKKKKKA